MQMEKLTGLLHLELEGAQTWAENQYQAQECEALMSFKVKLEDNEDFGLDDALDNGNSSKPYKGSPLTELWR
jgi:hypothetical protein